MTMKDDIKREHRDHYLRMAGVTVAFVAVVIAWYVNWRPEYQEHLVGAMAVLLPAVADVWRVRRRHKKVERESLAPPAKPE